MGQRVLVGRSSSGAGLAGCCSSYWSEAGSGGGTRELHSRRNKMAQTETTAINDFSLSPLLRVALQEQHK